MQHTEHEQRIRDAQAGALSRMAHEVKGFAQTVMLSERPPHLGVASEYRRDYFNDNMGLEDPVSALNDPILYSEERYREEQAAGSGGKTLPFSHYGKNENYVISNTITDGHILMKQGQQLPPQDMQQYFTSIQNKQMLAGREYHSLLIASKQRSLRRQNIGHDNPIIAMTQGERAKPPLISPETSYVTVPKREGGRIVPFVYEVGEFYENRPLVESMLTPEAFTGQERQDYEREYGRMGVDVQRALRMRSKMSVARGPK